MGFAFYAPKPVVQQKQTQQPVKKQSSTPVSFFSHVKNAVRDVKNAGSAVGRFVAGGTSRLANTAVAEGRQVVDTTKEITANVTHNPKAFRNALTSSQSDYNKDNTGKGGLFNTGTVFKNSKEAQSGSLKTGLKRIGGNTLESATEIIPFAKGLKAVEGADKAVQGTYKAVKAERAVQAAKTVTKSEKAVKALVTGGKQVAEGSAYGAVGNVADDIANDKKLTLSGEIKSALMGGVTQLAGFGVGKGFSKLLAKKAADKSVDIKDLSENDIHDLLPKKIAVQDVSQEATGKVSNSLPTTPRPEFQPTVNNNYTDADFRLKFNKNAAQAAKDIPAVADQYLKSGSKDATGLVVSHLMNNDGTGVGKVIGKLIPGIEAGDKKDVVQAINSAKTDKDVKDILYNAATNTDTKKAVGNEVVAPSKTISFQDNQTPVTPGATQATTFSNALVGKPASIGAPLDEAGNYTSGEMKGQPPLTNFQNLAETSPTEAKNTIAAAATEPTPSISTPVERAKTALMGVDKTKTADEATTPVGKGAQNIAQKLDEQLTTYNKDFKAPDEIMKKLKPENVATKARKNDWLNHYEDTASVAGRHFGQVGTDIVNKLAEGAKQVSDIQEAVRPSLDKASSLLDKAAKSKQGRADIQSRIYSALENRDAPNFNPSDYLKTPVEKQIFEETAKVFDFFKDQRVARGKSVVGESYSPRAAVSDALKAPERLLDDARSAFSTDVKSKFSKERVNDIPDAEINKNIIDLLPSYVSSQSKEFGYEGALQFAKENLPKVNPAYLTDAKSRRQGTEYMSNLFSQVLDPPTVSNSERFQNKLIANTYKASLGLSPKFALQNLTQRFVTRAQVSKEAIKLSKVMDKNDIDTLRKGITSGNNPLTGEATATANGLGTVKKGILSKIDPGMKVEKGNVIGAFDKGAAQGIVNSSIYKDALKRGLSPKDAAKEALKDLATADLATRHGNTVVNDTQFGANFVTKPEFFRKTGTILGLSDKWFKQYQRFPQGMVQNLSTILRGNDARALDILKRGDPTQTPLVDYLKSAQALHSGVDDLIKGIKSGEVNDVSMEVAQGYKKSLGNAVGELNKQIKANSQIRGGKTLKNVGKMWAAASAIQFLFDGGASMQGDNQSKELGKSLAYGSPISIPTRDQNPLVPSLPSMPVSRSGINTRKALDLIPGVGLAYSRGHDILKFIKGLTGQQ